MKKLVLVLAIAAIAFGGVAVALAGDGPTVVRARVLVCHMTPGGHAQTLAVAAPAAGAHLDHGDYRGPCE
jgi:hypothetical protein